MDLSLVQQPTLAQPKDDEEKPPPLPPPPPPLAGPAPEGSNQVATLTPQSDGVSSPTGDGPSLPSLPPPDTSRTGGSTSGATEPRFYAAAAGSGDLSAQAGTLRTLQTSAPAGGSAYRIGNGYAGSPFMASAAPAGGWAGLPNDVGGQYAPPGQLASTYNLYDQFVRQGLDQPSRFDNPMVQQGLQTINRNLDLKRDQGFRAVAEQMASRGVLGGSPEALGLGEVVRDIENQRAQQAYNLALTQAETLQGDRNAVAGQALGLLNYGGQYGLGYAQLGESARQADLGAMLQREQMAQQGSQFGQGLQFSREQLAAQTGLSQQDIDLKARDLQQQAQQFGQTLSFEQAQAAVQNAYQQQVLAEQQRQFGGTMGFQYAQLGQQGAQFQQQMAEQMRQFNSASADQRAQFLAQLGISQQQVDQEAERIRNQASEFGQQISLEQARLSAQTGLAENSIQYQYEQLRQQTALGYYQMGQQGSQFQQTLSEQQRQYNLGLQQQQSEQQQAQAQFQATLAQNAQQFGANYALQQAAQQLQAQGMSFEQAYQSAQLALQQWQFGRQQQLAALDLYGRYGGASGFTGAAGANNPFAGTPPSVNPWNYPPLSNGYAPPSAPGTPPGSPTYPFPPLTPTGTSGGGLTFGTDPFAVLYGQQDYAALPPLPAPLDPNDPRYATAL